MRLTWRLDAFYAFLCGGLLIALFVSARWCPDDPGDRPPAGQIAWRVLAGRAGLVAAGTGLYFLMIGAVWGYLEGIARAAGLSLQQTGTALSGGLVVSLLGSGAAAWLGLRFGRVRPLMVSALVQVISLALLTRLSHYADPVAAFFVINAAFQIMWSYVVSYFIITFNDVDATGRSQSAQTTVSVHEGMDGNELEVREQSSSDRLDILACGKALELPSKWLVVGTLRRKISPSQEIFFDKRRIKQYRLINNLLI